MRLKNRCKHHRSYYNVFNTDLLQICVKVMEYHSGYLGFQCFVNLCANSSLYTIPAILGAA